MSVLVETQLPKGTVNLRLFWGDFNGSGNMNQVRVDPFPHLVNEPEGTWDAAVAAAGFRIRACAGTVTRLPDETDTDFIDRAVRVAGELTTRTYKLEIQVDDEVTGRHVQSTPEMVLARLIEMAKGAPVNLFALPSLGKVDNLYTGTLDGAPVDEVLAAIGAGVFGADWQEDGVRHAVLVMPSNWEAFESILPAGDDYIGTRPDGQMRLSVDPMANVALVRGMLDRYGAEYLMIVKGRHDGDTFFVFEATRISCDV